MNNMSPVEAVFQAYSFKGVACCVDVGGGLGSFLAACMTQYPRMLGCVFDLPHVIEHSKQVRPLSSPLRVHVDLTHPWHGTPCYD